MGKGHQRCPLAFHTLLHDACLAACVFLQTLMMRSHLSSVQLFGHSSSGGYSALVRFAEVYLVICVWHLCAVTCITYSVQDYCSVCKYVMSIGEKLTQAK